MKVKTSHLRSKKAVMDNSSVHTKRRRCGQRWSLEGGWEGVAHTAQTLILVTGRQKWAKWLVSPKCLQLHSPVFCTCGSDCFLVPRSMDPADTPHTVSEQNDNQADGCPVCSSCCPLLCAVLPGCLNSLLVFLPYILGLEANFCWALLALFYIKSLFLLCVRVPSLCARAMTHVWRTKKNIVWSVLSFHLYVDSRKPTQVARLA